MEKNNQKLVSKCTKNVNSLALSLAKKTVNLACPWVTYQPKVPETLKKFRKF